MWNRTQEVELTLDHDEYTLAKSECEEDKENEKAFTFNRPYFLTETNAKIAGEWERQRFGITAWWGLVPGTETARAEKKKKRVVVSSYLMTLEDLNTV